jgi:hypothetical protein
MKTEFVIDAGEYILKHARIRNVDLIALRA